MACNQNAVCAPRQTDAAIEDRLYATEYHRFKSRGKWLLFQVSDFAVIDSVEEDVKILALAESGCSETQFRQYAVANGMDVEKVATRINILKQHNILINHQQPLPPPPLHPDSGYATFMVNVAQRCNLTCPYCYVNKGLFDYAKKPVARMNSRTASQLITQVYKHFPGFSTYGYHFYGGEPLLNFKVIRQIVAAAQLSARQTGTQTDFHITTNGTLLTPEVADFMDEHHFTVYFSIDGNQATHDELRQYVKGGGSYKDVKRNLEHLRKKPNVHLIGSSVIRNGLTLSDAIDLLADHGAEHCKAERVRLQDSDDLALHGARHDSYIDDIESLTGHYIDALEARQKPMDFRLSSKILQVLNKRRREFFCPAGKQMFGISANAEIYPCALHVGRENSKLGDLERGIDQEKQADFRHRYSVEGQPACATCWSRYLCGGGCSAMVDRFGHEDCRALRAESEAAIAVFHHFTEDKTPLFGLVSPKLVQWANDELDDPKALQPSEPGAHIN